MEEIALYGDVETPQNPSMSTPYTLFHFMVGMYAFLVLRWLYPRISLIKIFAIWFLIHGMYEMHDIFGYETTNSAINSFGDTIAAMSGFVVMACVFPDRLWNFQEVFVGGFIIFMANILIDEPPTPY